MGFQESTEEKHWGSVWYCNWVSHISAFTGKFLMLNHPYRCSHVLQSHELFGYWHQLIFHFCFSNAPGLTCWQAAQQFVAIRRISQTKMLHHSFPTGDLTWLQFCIRDGKYCGFCVGGNCWQDCRDLAHKYKTTQATSAIYVKVFSSLMENTWQLTVYKGRLPAYL